jgi:hypothetical protein
MRTILHRFSNALPTAISCGRDGSDDADPLLENSITKKK